MKKIILIFALVGLFVACTQSEEDLTEGMFTLEMSLNSTAFVGGETMTATLADISDSEVTRGNLTVYFSVINLSTNSYDHSMFEVFPETAVFGADQSEITVDFVPVSEVEQSYSLRLVAAAENTDINGDNVNFSLSSAYQIYLSVTDSDDGRVKEGGSFTVTATSDKAPAEDLTVSLSFDDESYFSYASADILIPAGQKTGVSGSIAVVNDSGDYQSEITVKVRGTTSDSRYVVSGALSVIRVDKDTSNGSYLDDERWVYDDPTASFYSSSNNNNSYFNCPSYKENDVLMQKYDYTTGENGSAHPNSTLAAEGWTLLNACEFHALDGWAKCRTALNSYGVHPVKVENGWGAQQTTGVEKSLYVDNEKYTDVTDDGYLRLWACPDAGYTNAGDFVFVGGAGCYANKVNQTMAIPQNTPIGEGTRVEIRARLRGDREGFLLALWMQGNATELTWPEYGEIDILENHVNIGDDDEARNLAEQTIHWGYADEDSNPTHNNPSVASVLSDVEDWNIYWVEITDANTVKFGVNGYTTATLTASDVTNNHNDYTWPFNNTANPSGFHILLDLYAGWNYDNGSNPADWGTSTFQNMSYDESITSDNAPRLEIDWIRYWKNDNYDYSSMYFPFEGNNASAQMF